MERQVELDTWQSNLWGNNKNDRTNIPCFFFLIGKDRNICFPDFFSEKPMRFSTVLLVRLTVMRVPPGSPGSLLDMIRGYVNCCKVGDIYDLCPIRKPSFCTMLASFGDCRATCRYCEFLLTAHKMIGASEVVFPCG